MAKITILGSGGWGMALAISAFNNRNDVTLWSPFQEEVDMLLQKRTPADGTVPECCASSLTVIFTASCGAIKTVSAIFLSVSVN